MSAIRRVLPYAPLALLVALSAAPFLVSAEPQGGAISIEDAYARASSPTAKSGAAFMLIVNTGDLDDRLISVQSGAAARVEIHTHIEDANGVMRMVAVEDGIVVPAGGVATLARGGDHIMFMGLTEPFEHDSTVAVTFEFESGAQVEAEILIDMDRLDTGATN
ncbi:MAG: copper chaperone PCu(A)C [Pseudomonadota bacterium]